MNLFLILLAIIVWIIINFVLAFYILKHVFKIRNALMQPMSKAEYDEYCEIINEVLNILKKEDYNIQFEKFGFRENRLPATIWASVGYSYIDCKYILLISPSMRRLSRDRKKTIILHEMIHIVSKDYFLKESLCEGLTELITLYLIKKYMDYGSLKYIWESSYVFYMIKASIFLNKITSLDGYKREELYHVYLRKEKNEQFFSKYINND